MRMQADLPVIDLTDPDDWQCLAAVLAPAREAAPVGIMDSGVPIVLRHEEMEATLKNPAFLQNDLSFLGHPPDGFVNRWYGQSLAAINPPDHTRIRSLVSRAFTPRQMEAMRAAVARMAEETMAPMIASGQFDALGRFSQDVPVKAVMAIFDIPEAERDLFFDLAHDFGLMFSFTAAGNPDIEARLARAIDGLDAYVADLIARRRREPGTDLLSVLAQVSDGEEALTEQELIILVGTFLYAGVETTEAMLPIVIALLAQHPDQFEALRANPALLANAVDEAMRFEPNVAVIARVAGARTDLFGLPLEAGQLLLTSVVAANRDPRRWDEPDRFRIDRDKPRTVGFGVGIHHCIGAPLARIELQESVRQLLRARRIELLGEPRWEPFSNTRQFDRVEIGVTL